MKIPGVRKLDAGTTIINEEMEHQGPLKLVAYLTHISIFKVLSIPKSELHP